MMKQVKHRSLIFIFIIILFSSCSVIEKTSIHGFESGFYHLKSAHNPVREVYIDISEEEFMLYEKNENNLVMPLAQIPFSNFDSLYLYPTKFTKTGLDIDITSIPLKLRPPVYDLPMQMNVDFNVALYTGWRHDTYFIRSQISPIKKYNYSIVSRGYDFGLFAGLGSTAVGPFSTKNLISDEYSGMIIQFGLAGFIESSFASFGIATGYDYLVSPDRNLWIYNRKPWIGLIIGIALN